MLNVLGQTNYTIKYKVIKQLKKESSKKVRKNGFKNQPNFTKEFLFIRFLF